MTVPARTRDIEAERRRTHRAQGEAADPGGSVWVSANAGTGKTHVLTLRVLRLMLAGTPPERILCLTYTKAAAAEMSARVFDKLAEWAVAPQQGLLRALYELLDRDPTTAEIGAARTLFARAIETPGGLKVQTIHAFCERLLQRFPLEAGVPPGFSILDEETARALQREAIDLVLHEATRDTASLLADALRTVIAYAADDRFDEVVVAALQRRDWLEIAVRFDPNDKNDTLAALDRLYRRAFHVREGVRQEDIDAELGRILFDDQLARLRDALLGGSITDIKCAEKIAAALAAPSTGARVRALAGFFCTSSGEPRKKLMTNALKAAHRDLDSLTVNAQTSFLKLLDERRGLAVATATVALIRLADAVMRRYQEAKARRAALDYDDLIAKAASLLNPARYDLAGNATEWVLFKLDGGIDHLLVDEAQDTSPAQWRIVEALVSDFFSGTGQREAIRTVFAVGDEKQSIYSFQGAVPKMFAEKGAAFGSLVENAGCAWRPIPLNLSFRTVAPVLDAVDRVFADPDRTPGLTATAVLMEHIASRAGHAGLVELWPTERPDPFAPADAWAPLDELAETSPVERLAARIADTIKSWLVNREPLVSENRPIRAGDILILVRKRKPFAGPMVAALKARRIAVAGADRLMLTEQIAVQDLIALGDFLTLPEDDLALATVLKSPLFDLDDDDLLAIAPGRKGTLWKALLDSTAAAPKFRTAADTLKRWRSRADFAPPFEFFASLLDKDGGRARLLARLGPEAADPLDEFLDLALTYDDDAPPSLTGFLAWLRATERQVKRDMEQGRDEVRVMTVHGAKGLEAPIVFLPDTCTTASGGRNAGRLLTIPCPEDLLGAPDPFFWPIKGTSGHPTAEYASVLLRNAETEERNRLLYVAMTRARDRLYVAGFDGKQTRPENCWYDLIDSALTPVLQPADAANGQNIRRLAVPQTAEFEKPKLDLHPAVAPLQPPPWASRPAPRVPELTIPLAPSRLEAYARDESGEPSPTPRARNLDEPPALSPARLADNGRFLRGTLTHALLQHLPSLPQASWPGAAKAFVAQRGAALPPRVRESIVAETLAILTGRIFAPLFGPDSRAEVPITALIPRPHGKGPALRLSGQIDRLVEIGGEVLIVDYKTNRPPPSEPERVAAAYLCQLAAYRLALAEIYPGRRIRAALLWTDGPRIMEIPQHLLDAAATRLWALDPTRLDGNL